MKELHNHIFSNTTCISKETMLRYINKQLSKNELYEVEKHMLDCELCSDAYEGMQFAKNSSILFAIDSQIDQRVGTGNFKAPVMKNLMVAASVLVIIFGAYFTFNFFNTTIENGSGLAVNELEESNQEIKQLEEQGKETEEGIKGKLNAALEDDEGIDSEGSFGYRAEVNGDVPILQEQTVVLNNIVSYDIEEAEEQVIISADITTNERSNKKEGIILESLDDVETSVDNNGREDDFSTVLEPEINTPNAPVGWVANNEPKTDKSGESLKKEEKQVKNRTRSKDGKKSKFKSNDQAPAYAEVVPVEEAKESRDRNQQKILIIDTYKVIDYTDEYQKEYDLKNANTIVTKSVSAGYENQEDKDVAEKAIDEITVEVTYEETLEKAIKLYKNKKYVQAIAEFDVILKEHSDEVNGLFYSALSHYHLKQYTVAKGKLDLVLKNKEKEFNEEAKWYKVLILIELKQTASAKKILEEIIKTDGFYKTKAELKLKGL
ncbi:MAG: hypothetical protein JKX68_13390 [Flavobacteriales bacterium]|nr:hypothetical protein [Flavobacteriales bacterium]